MRATQADWEQYHDELSFGDPHAREFSAMWSSFCHMFDDVIDGENITPEGFVSELIRIIGVFSFNPFYEQHKVELFPLIVQAANAFLDSWRWADETDRLKHNHANALRTFYDCVNYQVAYISKIGSHLDNAKRLNEMGYGRVRNEMLDATLDMAELQTFVNQVKDRGES